VSSSAELRAVPVEDRAWLLAAVTDAIERPEDRTSPILPLAPGTPADAVEALRGQPLPDGTAIVVRTSGSSGVPKAVALSAEALRSSARATHDALGPAPGLGGQWLIALPAHLISGLQMVVRGIVAGTEPVFVDGSFDPETLLAEAERMTHPQRYVSLVPVQLARTLDVAERDASAADAVRGFSGVLVGGQAVSLELRRRAHELGVNLRRSYGMTETAGGCVYDGVEIGDTRIRIRQGEVHLAGSTLALGYVGDAELTAARFVEDQGRDGSSTRWFRTGDAGHLLGGMLTVTGRIDRVVISGGVNVSLDEVERVVREFPGWSSTVALGRDHVEWGERVVLVVESEAGAVPFTDVQHGIREQLGPAAEPLWVTEAERLPRLPGGKPDIPQIESWLTTLRASFSQLSDR